MDNKMLEKKVDNLLEDLKAYIESQSLTEHDLYALTGELDKILYECLYYKAKLVC